MIPFDRIDRASSSIFESSMLVRGWNLFGRSRSLSTSSARSPAPGGAASGMSAESPRPSAGRLSAMVVLRRSGNQVASNDFTREREIRFGAAGLHVVGDRGHAMARCFAEPDVPRDHGVVDALLKKCADVLRDLLSQVRAL